MPHQRSLNGAPVCLLVAALMLLPSIAYGSQTRNYGWEDGGTILGKYGNVDDYNVTAPDPVHGDTYSLKLIDQSSTGPSTPQAYVAWVTGLQQDDQVDASFWRYDTSPGVSPPSCRIWGSYTSDPNDIDSYVDSASGNYDYGPGTEMVA